MDIISHGLWGGAAFGRKNKKSFWTAFLFGVSPDFLSFGIFSIGAVLGFYARPEWDAGHLDQSLIPSYLFLLYNMTHSLVVFSGIFLAVWAWKKKPFWEMGSWGLHILFDIPSHAARFFATPFLWPISDFKVDGVAWIDPRVYVANLTLLFCVYLFFFFYKNLKKNRLLPQESVRK